MPAGCLQDPVQETKQQMRTELAAPPGALFPHSHRGAVAHSLRHTVVGQSWCPQLTRPIFASEKLANAQRSSLPV